MSTNTKVLTPVITKSTARDALAVVDVYKEKAKGVVNDVTDFFDSYGINRATFSKGLAAAKALVPVINAVNSRDPAQILSRLMSATGKNSALMKVLPEGMADTIGSYIGDKGEQAFMLAGQINYINNTDFKSVSSITNLVNGITGDPNLAKFEDRDGITGLYVGLITECKELGLPSMLGKIGEYQQDIEIMQRTAVGVVDTAIRFSDTNLMRDINSTLGIGNLESSMPGATGAFLASYSRDLDAKRRSDNVNYDDIVDMLDKLDPQWTYETRMDGEETVVDASVVRLSSEQAKEVFGSGFIVTRHQDKEDHAVVFSSLVIPSYTVQEGINTMIHGNMAI